jgi:multicomponent K+:H+ antiporter subunit E
VFNQTLSLGHALLGAVVAFIGCQVLAALEIPRVRFRQARSIGRLIVLVLTDIVRSNVAVALIVLGLGSRRGAPGFVEIPLELRNPYGLATLACIITSTPGTVWVEFSEADGVLTIHVLDLVEKVDWIRTIKERYERLLREIFI